MPQGCPLLHIPLHATCTNHSKPSMPRPHTAVVCQHPTAPTTKPNTPVWARIPPHPTHMLPCLQMRTTHHQVRSLWHAAVFKYIYIVFFGRVPFNTQIGTLLKRLFKRVIMCAYCPIVVYICSYTRPAPRVRRLCRCRNGWWPRDTLQYCAWPAFRVRPIRWTWRRADPTTAQPETDHRQTRREGVRQSVNLARYSATVYATLQPCSRVITAHTSRSLCLGCSTR